MYIAVLRRTDVRGREKVGERAVYCTVQQWPKERGQQRCNGGAHCVLPRGHCTGVEGSRVRVGMCVGIEVSVCPAPPNSEWPRSLSRSPNLYM